MDLKAIQQLLQEAQPILQKSKAEKKEREAKGEYFSVFEYLNFSRFEEQLHTPFFVCCLIRMPIMEWGKASCRLF